MSTLPFDQDERAPQLKQAQAEQELRRRTEIEDLKWLMAHRQGRRFVTRLLEESGVFRTSFHASGSVMAFNEGRKTIGLLLTSELLEHAPEAYVKLLKEYRNG